MVANILHAESPSPTTLGMGSIGKNSTFTEHGHAACQIKWNHEMHQHGSKYFAHRPPSHALTRSIGHKATFSEHGHVAYQIKGNHEFSNMVANILHADPPPPGPRGMGSKYQNTTFSEHGHVAYQIKEVHECSNMVTNISLADLPASPDPAGGVNRSKFNIFRTWSCCITN